MDFETATKGANPFLMEDLTDYTSATQLGGGGLNSNPFLSNSDFNIPSSSENPFLSSISGVEISDEASSSPFSATPSGTNPFASFVPDYSESNTGIDLFGSTNGATVSSEETITSSNIYTNIFSDNTIEPLVTSAEDFFSNIPTSMQATTIQPQALESTQLGGIALLDDAHTTFTESVDDFCKETSDIFSSGVIAEHSSSRTSTPKGGGPPRRPPPPRPPPSQETKNLILSVTGAMEATSSHLLDRLKATRTPSPTPIRDLHSPSPTPDMQFSDLLGDDTTGMTTGTLPAFPSRTELNFLEDTEEVITSNVPPGPPQPPPRPGRPPAQPFAQKPVQTNQDIMDIFSSEAQSQPIVVENTNTDFLGLFDSTPSQISAPPTSAALTESGTTDFLFGDAFGDAGGVKEISTAQEVNFMSSSPAGLTDLTSDPDVVDLAPTQTDNFSSNIDNFSSNIDNFSSNIDNFSSNIDNFSSNFNNFSSNIDNLSSNINNVSSVPTKHGVSDDFDAFSAKFDSAVKEDAVAEDPFDPFASSLGTSGREMTRDAWGTSADQGVNKGEGFGADESFDAFLSMNQPPTVPQPAPQRLTRNESAESDEGRDFSIFIKPKLLDGDAPAGGLLLGGPVPTLAPPPKSPVNNAGFLDSSPRFNPFDKSNEAATTALPAETEDLALPQGPEGVDGTFQRTDSQETPPTPLFDEDVSQPLEDFPRVEYKGDGWEMHLRQPNKKKITGQRFWKKVFVRLVNQGDNPVLQLYNTKEDKDPFQELPLQACYSVSDIGAQQFDAYGKIFTVKLQYVFYKERPGVRPGQVTKAERLTNKLSQFAAYAIQGDYQGCKEFGSDLRKLGLPVEHAPQVSQLFKIGSQNYEDVKQFSMCVEESLFRLSAHRDRALNYKNEEVQITAVDEIYVEQDQYGHVEKQIARVRLCFLGFLSGMPDVELGVNDLWRQGKEVVGRHDIIPVVTEEWIRLENIEFHSCVQLDEYQNTHIIKFKPPDACYIELMRFRVRPPKNRELPLQVKAVLCVTGNKVELKADILVPGFSSRKLGQIPCEDVMVRFPIPECWIYLFRVEKHFRYGSVKSTHRRTGKVKGIERFLGAVETLEQSLIEVTSGNAKYEHQHRAIVWRMSRLPKEGQGAYTTHSLVCRMGLTSYDQIPDQLAEYCYVEFTMPATQVSHTTIRSVSLVNSAKDDPPEKYVRYLARHEYRVGIEHTQGEGPGAYISATMTKPAPAPEPAPVLEEKEEPPEVADSDSDSSS